MPETDAQEHEEQRIRRTERDIAQEGPGYEQPLTSEPAAAYPVSLLSDPHLGGRGNAPVRSAILQRMQATYGNRATTRYVQRDPDGGTATLDPPASTPGTATPTTSITGPTVITVGTEKVEVSSDDEKKEAERIVKDIKEKYGIDLSSTAGVDAIRDKYTKAPQGVRDALKTKEWKFKELAALDRALAHFAAILGKNRALSNRAGDDQEITTASKVDQAIDRNTSSGALDTTTLGEFFSKSKNFSMFTAGEDKSYDFSGDNAKQLEGTAVHEIAHGLMKYALPDYVKGLDYWTDESTASGKAGAEAPITKYGATNASEDLSEAVMFYFVEPATLKAGKGQPNGSPGNPCPKRYELIEGFVSKWKPPVGDFPDPPTDTAYA